MGPITLKCCVGCGNSTLGTEEKTGKPTCPICGGQQFEDRTVDPKTATCTYCKTTGEQALKYYTTLPYYNPQTNSFYCGCRGWD